VKTYNIPQTFFRLGITARKMAVLEKIGEGNVEGVCANYIWRYLHQGKTLNKQHVVDLKAAGLASELFFSGGKSAVHLTEHGRDVLRRAIAHRKAAA
jgi:hypothetical protein